MVKVKFSCFVNTVMVFKLMIVITLGFEEKFALRCVLRSGVSPGDRILVLTSKNGSNRSNKAFILFKQVISEIFPEILIKKFEIDVKDFYSSVSKIREIILSHSKPSEKVILNISGGQRILIVELLSAAISIGSKDYYIEIETEDSSKVVQVPLTMMLPSNIDDIDRKILREVELHSKGISLSELCKKTNMSKSTVWRRLDKMCKLGLVSRDAGRKYRITNVGRSRV